MGRASVPESEEHTLDLRFSELPFTHARTKMDTDLIRLAFNAS